MLNEEDYIILKNSFIESQRLFNKLNNVSNQASELEYDESGMYADDEEILERHWLKLSSKIVDSLSDSLIKHAIELVKNDNLDNKVSNKIILKILNEINKK